MPSILICISKDQMMVCIGILFSQFKMLYISAMYISSTKEKNQNTDTSDSMETANTLAVYQSLNCMDGSSLMKKKKIALVRMITMEEAQVLHLVRVQRAVKVVAANPVDQVQKIAKVEVKKVVIVDSLDHLLKAAQSPQDHQNLRVRPSLGILVLHLTAYAVVVEINSTQNVVMRILTLSAAGIQITLTACALIHNQVTAAVETQIILTVVQILNLAITAAEILIILTVAQILN